ncbi:MAG: M23 family metallopeptidase [Bacteroidetes bacterium]|nr:M23 family metallopeptidase [Bacteroidota bacterium]
MKRFFLLSPFLFFVTSSFSQLFPPKNYPQGYFRDPLNIPISLAGNFGELRPNHYHMGLDIRTEKRENLPVFAAADGYIAKVKVEPEGFGQAIYINHPNGYTTLYAHLNEFFPALAAYVKKQQYKSESWKIFLNIPPGMFPVKKGDFIALSGSTGGSQAPHVHFEIRNTSTDINCNPMLFGLPITDNSNPTLLRLAVYDRSKSIYEQSPKIFPVHKIADEYSIPGGSVTCNFSQIGFAISAFDTESGSTNRNGIFEAALYNDEKAVIGFEMNNIGYDNTRNINAHIDYKTKANSNIYLQQLFRLSGYNNSIYHPANATGIVDIGDGTIHTIKIEVKDPRGNTTILRFNVQYKPAATGNWQAPGKMFYPQMLGAFETDDCAFYINENCLYDSVHINYLKSAPVLPSSVSAIHHIGAPYIPLRDSFLVRIKPTIELSVAKQDKVVMLMNSGNKKSVEKVQWQAGWASATFRDLGNFQLVVDDQPPVIIPVGFHDGANLAHAAKIVFIVKDNFEEFKNFRAELDGKWLKFSNDKERSFVYKFDEHFPPGKHELKVTVYDEAGNQAMKTFSLRR